jgi:hypothetical protein
VARPWDNRAGRGDGTAPGDGEAGRPLPVKDGVRMGSRFARVGASSL